MSAVVGSEQFYDGIDARTLEILERRRNAKSRIKRRGWLVRRALLTADMLGLLIAFVVAETLYSAHAGNVGALNRAAEFGAFALSLPVWVVGAKLYRLYEKDEERTDHSTSDDFARVFHLVTVCTCGLYVMSHVTRLFNPQFGKLLPFWLAAIAAVVTLRAIARTYCRRRIQYLQNTVIVGAGQVGQLLATKLLKHPEYGLNLVGFIDDRPMEPIAGLDHLTVLGGSRDLREMVSLLDVERVIYAFCDESHDASLDAIRQLNELGIQVDIVPRFFEVLSPSVDVHTVEGVPVWGLRPSRLPASSRLIKRMVDVAIASVGLVALTPVFVAISLAILLDSRGPVFFRQRRIGALGVGFGIWKFRTMDEDAELRKCEVAHLNKHLVRGGDPRMFKIDDDPRATRVGRFLRALSLDELPQLINVLRGEMSLVGPRPLIADEHKFVEAWASRRLDLKPGMTGLWQTLGSDAIGFEEMVKLDYLYVTSWSLAGDFRILMRTLPAVVRRRN